MPPFQNEKKALLTVLMKSIGRQFPWGQIFALSRNFRSGYFDEEARLVAKYLRPNSNVLIIGSGNGREARPICRGTSTVICMDIGLIYLLSGRHLFARENISTIRFVQADMTFIPFASESFDFVFYSLYSYAGSCRYLVLQNIHRILSSGGLVLMMACTPVYWSKYPKEEGWFTVNSAVALRQDVISCGFDVVESEVDLNRSEYRISLLKKRFSE